MLSSRVMRSVSCPRATYQRRQPHDTVLYRKIAAHLTALTGPPLALEVAEEHGRAVCCTGSARRGVMA
jgi:hypothetical protein